MHGDFHLLNVIAAPATAASARSWTESCARSAIRSRTWAGCSPELAAVYADVPGRGLEELGFWHVFFLWKVAIIGDGVLRRPRDQATTAFPTRVVDDIVARAEAVAGKVGL